MSVDVSRQIDTGVILIGVAIHANQCLVLTELNACPVRYLIMGKRGIKIV